MGKVRLNCDHCGHFFWVYPSRKDSARFCNLECKKLNQITKIEINCSYCGSSTKKVPSKISKNNNNFCNRTCLNKFKKEKKEKTLIHDECSYCGKSITYCPSRVKECCSHTCDALYRHHISKGHKIGKEILYPKTAKLRRKIRKIRWRERMSDGYIKTLLTQHIPDLEPKDIPDKLIIVKRNNLKLKRRTRNV